MPKFKNNKIYFPFMINLPTTKFPEKINYQFQRDGRYRSGCINYS